VETPGLALTLLYWHSWRRRLDRLEQSRLHRKDWVYSQLLFPNSQGEALKKQALHDALSRLGVPELGVRRRRSWFGRRCYGLRRKTRFLKENRGGAAEKRIFLGFVGVCEGPSEPGWGRGELKSVFSVLWQSGFQLSEHAG
jgi:hypothetical protein